LQFDGCFFATQTNLDKTTNTLPLIASGQSESVILTNGNNIIWGAFTGNGAGLTCLNAAQLTGTLPAASLPGITTNISAAGITFYITNGLIMRVASP